MRLLPKSQLSLRLAPAEEPPAEEANEAPDDNNSSHGDTCDGAGRKAATLVDTRRYALRLVGVEVEARCAPVAVDLVGVTLGAVVDSAVGRGLFSALRGEAAHQKAESW